MKLHKDGLARDVSKMSQEWTRMTLMLRPNVRDWLRAPWNAHHYTDLFVESSRISPYFMGHIWAVYLPLSITAIWWLW